MNKTNIMGVNLSIKPDLIGHTSEVLSVAYSTDGRKIASGSRDQTTIIWNSNTGQSLLTLKGHTSVVSSVAFSKDGKQIASGSWDKTVKIWDSFTGKSILTLEGHTK